MRGGVVWAAMMLGMGGVAWGQTPAGGVERVVFERDWPVQAVPYYRIAVQADGTGEVVMGRGEGAVKAAITVSDGTRTKLLAVAPVVVGGKCETGNKHTAKTGEKTVTAVLGGAESKCTFNYTEDKRLQEAVTLFAGIETTVEEIPRLEKLMRYDRLGLDAELGTILQMAKDGRAVELQNLDPVLSRLESNQDVMERVRSRAAEIQAIGRAGR